MKASLNTGAGKRYEVASILMAPLLACLSKSEIEAVVALIKDTPSGMIEELVNGYEKPGAVAVSAALMTRFSNRPGMSEVSDILTLAGKYMDINEVMPPEGSEWKPNLVEALLPDSVNAAIDGMNDWLMALTVPVTKEYTTKDPVDIIVDSTQTPGYVNALFTTLNSNIKGIEFSIEEESAPGHMPVGWVAALSALLGGGVVALLSGDDKEAVVNSLSAEGKTTSDVTKDDVVRVMKDLGLEAVLSGAI